MRALIGFNNLPNQPTSFQVSGKPSNGQYCLFFLFVFRSVFFCFFCLETEVFPVIPSQAYSVSMWPSSKRDIFKPCPCTELQRVNHKFIAGQNKFKNYSVQRLLYFKGPYYERKRQHIEGPMKHTFQEEAETLLSSGGCKQRAKMSFSADLRCKFGSEDAICGTWKPSSGVGIKTYQINLSGIDGMERRVGSDLDFTRGPGFTTECIADVQSKYNKYLETWGRSLSVKSKLSVNMRLSES